MRSWAARALLLATLTTAMYWPSLRGEWLWDEHPQFIELPAMSAPDGLSRIWRGQTLQYYPVTFSALWTMRHFFGLNTVPYRCLNLALHIGSALLLWHLLAAVGVAEAWLAALLFALHPVNVESTAWIIELKNVLSGFFFFAALGAFWRFERDGRERWYAAALALFALALLSKTSTVMLPVVLVLGRWWLRRPFARRDWARLAPFFALAAAMSGVTILYEVGTGARGAEWALTFPGRCQLAGRLLWVYLGKLLWPRTLMLLYPRWPVEPGRLLGYLPAAAAVAAAAALAALSRGRALARDLAAGLGYFAANLFPVLGFFNVFFMRYSYVSDHFQYLASAGPLALAAGGAGLLGRRYGRPARHVAAALAVAALSALTWRQARLFSDMKLIWADTLEKNPDAFLAHNHVGLELANQGRVAEAMAHFERALQVSPAFVEARNSLGNALLSQGKLEEAAAQYREALRVSPEFAVAYNNLGVALARQGRVEEAIAQFRQGLALQPLDRDLNKNLGIALAQAGRVDEAIAHYQGVLARDPGHEAAAQNLAALLAKKARR